MMPTQTRIARQLTLMGNAVSCTGSTRPRSTMIIFADSSFFCLLLYWNITTSRTFGNTPNYVLCPLNFIELFLINSSPFFWEAQKLTRIRLFFCPHRCSSTKILSFYLVSKQTHFYSKSSHIGAVIPDQIGDCEN